MIMKTATASILLTVVLAAFTGSTATLHVSLQSTNPVPPFTHWLTAATNIQDAVNVARAGDTVLVTNGVYATGSHRIAEEWGSTTWNRVRITNAIRLVSVNGPESTIISGTRVVDASNWVIGVRCLYLGERAVASGFTLTNGAAPGGGGVCCESSAVVSNCVLTGNTAVYSGGGVFGGSLYQCQISNNVVDGGVGDGIESGVSGGGACQSTLWDCVLDGNWCWEAGGGASSCRLNNCTLTGNSAYYGGGADSCSLNNCTLTGNSTDYGGGACGSELVNCVLKENEAWGDGGGAGDSLLVNCLLFGNRARYWGGGACDGWLLNCVLVDNTAHREGGGAFGANLFNCILYYNYAEQGNNYAEGTNWGFFYPVHLNYCCTSPLPTNGDGNITGPPLFMDLAAGDFRLREGSPCIDAGTNLLGLLKKPLWVSWNMSPDGCEPIDHLGHTRFIDGNDDGKVAWDIGAYEFRSYKPARLVGPPLRLPYGCELTITGTPNKPVFLQWSHNLRDWENWWEYPFIMGAEGTVRLTDSARGQKATFYRLVERY